MTLEGYQQDIEPKKGIVHAPGMTLLDDVDGADEVESGTLLSGRIGVELCKASELDKCLATSFDAISQCLQAGDVFGTAPRKSGDFGAIVQSPFGFSGDRGGHESGGNGGDGGRKRKKKKGGSPSEPGNTPKGPTDSGTHPKAVIEQREGYVSPSPDVLLAQDILANLPKPIEIHAPLLLDTSLQQKHFRETFFGPTAWKTLYDMQNQPGLKDIENIADPAERVRMQYEIQALKDAYNAGEIAISNVALMFGFQDEQGEYDPKPLFCTFEGGRFSRKTSVELAAANGEISRDLRMIRDQHTFDAILNHYIPKGEENVPQAVLNEASSKARKAVDALPKNNDPNIITVDKVKQFVDRGRERGFRALQGDLCSTPEEFFEETGITPNSADFIYINLAFDRVDDIEALLKLINHLAKLDGSTKFLFGFYAPFAADMVSFSKNENIPQFECFDPQKDLREGWIGLSRAETIAKIIADLSKYGIVTENAAEHEYEVYNIHCISERAQTLREDPKYDFLRSHDFKDPVLNKRRDNVFSGKYADNDIVGFPERENVVLISGKVTAPEDGSRFMRKYTQAAE